jgi:hypothetical protein
MLSVSGHKLCKNVYLEKIHSVVQQIMISQTNLTVLICVTSLSLRTICSVNFIFCQFIAQKMHG